MSGMNNEIIPTKYRISSHRQFFSICKEHKSAYEKHHKRMSSSDIQGLGNDDVADEVKQVLELYEKREREAAIAITFAGMCVEAFMYNYAAKHLGDNYAKTHTDKLDICSKILILPRLICGKEIDKSSEVYSRIKRLVKDRNDLVHFKSKGFGPTDMCKINEFHEELNNKYREGVANCDIAVEKLMRQLDVMHGTDGHYYDSVCVW